MRRRHNGLFSFAFGKWSREIKVVINGKEVPLGPLVQIEIFGSLRMKCFRELCRIKCPDHWNEFTFFPKIEEREE